MIVSGAIFISDDLVFPLDDREAEIVGLPPTVTSFRIISLKSVCSTNEISAKKGIFWCQNTILSPFWPFLGPVWSIFNLI